MIVTLPELPYEKTVYERPVYPGTLTGLGTVPTIDVVTGVRDGGPYRSEVDDLLLKVSGLTIGTEWEPAR